MDNKTKQQINHVTQTIIDILNDKLVGIYLYGSAMMGGLKANSDLDFLVLTNKSLSNVDRERLYKGIKRHSKAIGEESSLRYVEITFVKRSEIETYTYPFKQEFIYGEWLREDFDQGIFNGVEENYDLTILLAQAKKFHRCLYGDFSLNDLLTEIPFKDIKDAMDETANMLSLNYQGDETNVLLTLCRMIVTAKTEDFYSKDESAIFCLKYLDKHDLEIVTLAKNVYMDGNNTDFSNYDVSKTVGNLYKIYKNVQ